MDIIDSLQSISLFTRSWLGLTFAITAAVTLDVIHAHQVVLDWDRIMNITFTVNRHGNYDRPELWRLLTSFCYCGAPLNQVYSLFLLYTIYLHSNQYEKNPFPAGSGSRTADTIFGAIFCAITLLCTHCVPEYLFGPTYALYPLLTRNLAGSMLYLWSKRNPRAMIQLNFVPMEGRYLPFAHIGTSLLMKNRPHELIHGFAVGHLYYFLIAIAPVQMGGRRILRAPQLLVQLIGEDGIVVSEEDEDYRTRREERQEFDYRDRDGATQAHVASKIGNLSQLQQLVEATTMNAGGHRRRLLLTARDRNGWQPLHEACRGGYIEIVRYLVEDQEQYIELLATTNGGDSALSLSQGFHGENHPVTQLLQQIIGSDSDDDDDDEH
mmetsp:Transcript_7447/g.16004  ORF Transcript_7447/g.16004 Transcript_7447/m.16004 type:complete len:380 (-) Transcript_7447:621-1760(-)